MEKRSERAKDVERPTYDLFLGYRSERWAEPFLRGLEPGIPQQLPQHGLSEQTSRNTIVTAAKRYGIPIATRKFGGAIWVCRLRDDDMPAEQKAGDGN